MTLKMEDDLQEFEEAKQRQRDARVGLQGKQLTFDRFNSPLPNKLKNEYSIDFDITQGKSRGYKTPQMFYPTQSDRMEEEGGDVELTDDFIHGLIQNIGRNNASHE